ncbi:Response regulator receiver domain protein [uncultured Desulfobacterium sp.]|uniref:Response regulator receiver domain protein n=1 Tax=uncultured Desulfobacterium sp. TaxID=201089 RepID=A0A445MS91_9BACT|nr:Response regulator receiver domain protein [uncultured Desulfobacterium sp.]
MYNLETDLILPETDKMAKHALVVDNDFFFMEFLSDLLEKRGYKVSKAQNGKDGISRLKEGPVDFLFLEIILPKIDGRQVIKFARKRFEDNHFPIIAVSGYLVEQMDDLGQIGADYYIAKGAIEKMGDHVDKFLDRIENQPLPGPDAKVILEEPGQVYPRQSSAGLMDILNFSQAVTESAGIGIIVVDSDAKIICANTPALEIVDRPMEDILNTYITKIFPVEEKERLADALKRVIKKGDGPRNIGFFVKMDSRRIRTNISALKVHDKKIGWVITMDDMDRRGNQGLID